MEQEFTVTRLRPHIYQLQNSVGNCATLVLGREKALLFDTMTGLGDLKAQVRELTDLPLTVVNSHGHFDHVGGNWQFECVYLSRIDWPLMEMNDYFLPEV
jgi:glyoxylase-like metal-dependent hydrolase (beta-lactamase superfamily II)